MKRLSEVTLTDNGAELAADMLDLCSRITERDEFKAFRQTEFSTKELAKFLIKTDTETLIEIFAKLSGTTPEEYKEKTTTASLITDIYTMLSDNDLMLLFGIVFRKVAPSSGTPTETTGAAKK